MGLSFSQKALIPCHEQASDLHAAEKARGWGTLPSVETREPTCGLNADMAASYRIPRYV